MIHWDALIVFIVFFAGVTVLGFVASRWRRGDLRLLDEWGLAGRGFGTLVTWFLLGGDLYTAYTFVAVPALVFGKGAIGLYAIPYTIVVYPLVYLIMPKLWTIAKERGHVTPADYVKDRFDSRLLALVIAITGIIATMPYIALQMLGIGVVIRQMGVNVELSLIIAFVVLALFTYVAGLRAPALIAIVKDAMIWLTVIVLVIYIPYKLGGYGAIFHKIPAAKLSLAPKQYLPYSTLFLGSALALFLYPHAITGVFSSRSRSVVARNAALLPAYSFMLGLIALLGFMALVVGVKPDKLYGANAAVPALIDKMTAGPFAGFAFAAIAIGALVPASVMSIAAANLFNRNIWREFIRPNETPQHESRVSQIVSLLVKLGALLFILAVSVAGPKATAQAIYFQLAGGVWIIQTLPAIFLALYVPWVQRWSVLLGWLVGIVWGTWMLYDGGFVNAAQHTLPLLGKNTVYIGLSSLVLNLVIVIVGSLLERSLVSRAAPETTPAVA